MELGQPSVRSPEKIVEILTRMFPSDDPEPKYPEDKPEYAIVLVDEFLRNAPPEEQVKLYRIVEKYIKSTRQHDYSIEQLLDVMFLPAEKSPIQILTFITLKVKGIDVQTVGFLTGHELKMFPAAKDKSFFVLAAYNGKMGGKDFWDRIKAALLQEGYKSVYTQIGADMGRAKAFERRYGFKVDRIGLKCDLEG